MPDQVAIIELTRVEKSTAEDVLENLVRQHARLVFKVAYSVLRNHHDAEDAAQETFLRVMRNRRELAGVTDMRAWLARICWRIAVDRLRLQKASGHWCHLEVTAVWEELQSREAGAERTAISAQMIEIAERLIAGLPRELRDILTLSAVSEMTSAETAEILGIPDASVRTRLHRARQLLKEKFAAILEGKDV